jgi:hypothetical protein
MLIQKAVLLNGEKGRNKTSNQKPQEVHLNKNLLISFSKNVSQHDYIHGQKFKNITCSVKIAQLMNTLLKFLLFIKIVFQIPSTGMTQFPNHRASTAVWEAKITFSTQATIVDKKQAEFKNLFIVSDLKIDKQWLKLN